MKKGREFYIVPTYKCNSDCPMCGVLKEKRESGWSYTLPQLRAQIDLNCPTQNDTIIISGGEPTIYKDTVPFIQYINETYGSKVVVFTNGRAFKSEKIIKQYQTLKIDYLLIPVFSHIPETHDLLTGAKGSFRDTTQGLSRLNQSGIPFRIKTVAMKANYQDMPELTDFLLANYPNARSFGFHGMHLQGDAPLNKNVVFVKHSDSLPFVESAAYKVLEQGLELILSAFPLCHLDPVLWKSYTGVNTSDEDQVIAPDKKQINATNYANYSRMPGKCGTCILRKNCAWPWKMYVDLVGENELRPLHAN